MMGRPIILLAALTLSACVGETNEGLGTGGSSPSATGGAAGGSSLGGSATGGVAAGAATGGQPASGGRAGEGGHAGDSGQAGEGGQATASAEDVSALRSKLRELVAYAGCLSDADCAALAIGAKPCGGPWEYWAYSKVSSDEATLFEVAGDLKRVERAYNEAKGIGSDCAFVEEPNVVCEATACVLADTYE